MNKLLFAFIALTAISVIANAQTNIDMSFGVCPTYDCWGKKDSIQRVVSNGAEPSTHQLTVLQTVGGQYVTPIVNYLYFTFPSVVKVIRCTNDSFPQPINTATSGQ